MTGQNQGGPRVADPRRSGYPLLSTLGVVGDGKSLAVLSPSGEVEWYCPLRPDAAPVFWSILDRHRGGRFIIRPVDDVEAKTFSYVEGTAVVSYVWHTDTGCAQVRVGMTWPPPESGQELWWVMEGISGKVHMSVDFDPVLGFGQEPFAISHSEFGSTVSCADIRLTLGCSKPLQPLDTQAYRRTVSVSNGEVVSVGLSVKSKNASSLTEFKVPATEDGPRALDASSAAWQAWSRALEYEGPHKNAVIRSAITLKLLIYEATGAVAAAATTSLPEEVGGTRNWDYRYCWLRDAGFTLNALHGLGCREEAQQFAIWMCSATAESGLPLRVLYPVAGGLEVPEAELEGIEGYLGSRPVRVGNGAQNQFQLDSYGELLDCLAICETLGDPVMRTEWQHFRSLVDFVADHWREPDSGIWEVRSKPQHFVHSKAMAWVALDRGVRLAEHLGLSGDVTHWQNEASALKKDVAAHGVDHERGRYKRSYEDPALDASILMLPLVGFCKANDPIMKATIDTVRAQLAPAQTPLSGLLYRYPLYNGDGIDGGEGTFSICSFWLVEALALAGQPRDAEILFTTLVGLGGDLGLFAEEMDPSTGVQLGNIPQAFTHIGLINAALCLYGDGGRSQNTL